MENAKKSVDLVPYKKALSAIEQKANSLTIKTEAEIKSASDILFQISEVAKRIKEEKNKIVKPAKEIIEWAKNTFGSVEKQCQEAEYIIKDKMIAYDKKKQAEAQKKLEKISEKVATGKIDLDKASEKIENLKPANSYEGASGSVQFRQQKVVVITDEAKIPREYLTPDMQMIKADAFRGVEIPGVKVEIQKIVAKGRI